MLAEKLQVDCYCDRLKLLERGLSDGKRLEENSSQPRMSAVLSRGTFFFFFFKDKKMVLWEKT